MSVHVTASSSILDKAERLTSNGVQWHCSCLGDAVAIAVNEAGAGADAGAIFNTRCCQKRESRGELSFCRLLTVVGYRR